MSAVLSVHVHRGTLGFIPSSVETARRVAQLLAERTDDDGLAALGQHVIADTLGIGLSTTGRAINTAVVLGWLEIVKRGTGSGFPTIYKVGDIA